MKIPSRRQLAITQGIYLYITGIWPLVSMNSFLYITGPKTDLWLVITVGLLLAIIGAVLGCSGIRENRQAEFVLLGIGTAASLAVIDIFFAIKGRISSIYLLDGMVELGFSFLWIAALIRENQRKSEPHPGEPGPDSSGWE